MSFTWSYIEPPGPIFGVADVNRIFSGCKFWCTILCSTCRCAKASSIARNAAAASRSQKFGSDMAFSRSDGPASNSIAK